jgi:hypothetical protein
VMQLVDNRLAATPTALRPFPFDKDAIYIVMSDNGGVPWRSAELHLIWGGRVRSSAGPDHGGRDSSYTAPRSEDGGASCCDAVLPLLHSSSTPLTPPLSQVLSLACVRGASESGKLSSGSFCVCGLSMPAIALFTRHR